MKNKYCLFTGTAANNGPGPLRDRNAHRGEHNKKRVTRLIIIVIVVFTLCWLPYNLVCSILNVVNFCNNMNLFMHIITIIILGIITQGISHF